MGMYGRHLDTEGNILPKCGTDLVCDVKNMVTKQAPANEVDINKIIAQYDKTGLITHWNSKEPFYGDVSGITSYAEAVQVVQEAQELFMEYPAEIREKFDNDPAKLIAFLDNKDNKEEAIKLGLVLKEPEIQPELTNETPKSGKPS